MLEESELLFKDDLLFSCPLVYLVQNLFWPHYAKGFWNGFPASSIPELNRLILPDVLGGKVELVRDFLEHRDLTELLKFIFG